MPSCSSCGSSIPEGQGSCCSMCYGDPHYGADGYYMQHLEQQERAAQEQREAAQQQHEMEQQQMVEK